MRLDQNQINEQHHKVVLDVLVGELLAAWALRQAHAFAQRPVVGFRVLCVQRLHGVAALDTDGHGATAIGREARRVQRWGVWSLEVWDGMGRVWCLELGWRLEVAVGLSPTSLSTSKQSMFWKAF